MNTRIIFEAYLSRQATSYYSYTENGATILVLLAAAAAHSSHQLGFVQGPWPGGRSAGHSQPARVRKAPRRLAYGWFRGIKHSSIDICKGFVYNHKPEAVNISARHLFPGYPSTNQCMRLRKLILECRSTPGFCPNLQAQEAGKQRAEGSKCQVRPPSRQWIRLLRVKGW